MGINAILPFISAVVMAVFVVFVFRRFFSRQRQAWYLGLWGVGLTFYLLGSLMEALHTALGWNPLVYRLWYLFGAILVAAWLGQGTAELLIRKRIGGVRVSHILLVLLTLASVYAGYKVFTAWLEPLMLADQVVSIQTTGDYSEDQVLAAATGALRATAVEDDGELSRSLDPITATLLSEAETRNLAVESASDLSVSQMPVLSAMVGGQTVALSAGDGALDVDIDGQPAGLISLALGHEMHGHAIVSPGVRVLTPFFNSYGLLLLAGGAIYSAYIFLRKRIMPNRVLGNVLIASGALMPAMGGLLSRFGLGGYLYLGELLGAILMFAGFLSATNKPEAAQSPQARPAEVTGDR